MSNSSNITIDDTSSYLVYSPGQWKQQPAGDPTALQYFSGTYHVSQEDNANVTITFNGQALYIYGSIGPGHADYSVRWSDKIQPLSAWAPSFKTQQLLWSRVFPKDGSEGGGSDGSGSHQILLQTHYNASNTWIDIDFLTFTVSGNGAASSDLGSYSTTNSDVLSSIATSTVLPGSQISSSASSGNSSSNGQTVPSHSTVNATLIATIVLAVLLVLGFASFVVSRFLKRKNHNPGTEHKYPWPPPTAQTSTVDTNTHLYARTFSPNPGSTSSTLPLAPSSTVDHNALSPATARNAQNIHETHNNSATGWNAESTFARATSPNSSSNPLASNNSSPLPSTSTLIRYPSGKPPSYNARYASTANTSGQFWSPQPITQISESDHVDSQQLQSPTSTEPLRIQGKRGSDAKRPSAAATANILRLAPPPRVKPKRPYRNDVNLYDDGDSRRTNFLQV